MGQRLDAGPGRVDVAFLGDQFELDKGADAVDFVQGCFDLAALPGDRGLAAGLADFGNRPKIDRFQQAVQEANDSGPGANGSSISRRVLVAASIFGPL